METDKSKVSGRIEQPAQTDSSGRAVPAKPTAPDQTGVAKRPDPTRYGDWERAGRCIDF